VSRHPLPYSTGPLTFREYGLQRAFRLLRTSNFEELYTPFFQSTAPYVTTQFWDVANDIVGGGSITSLSTAPTQVGGGLRCTTGAANNAESRAFTPGFLVAAMCGASGWMARVRLQPITAVAARQRFALQLGDSKAEVSLGVHGASVTGGSATKFSMIKKDSGNVDRAGATSTISLDLNPHVLEIWHPVGDANIYGSVDHEPALSMSGADMANGKGQFLCGAECGADAAAYTVDLFEAQIIIVRP